LNYFAFIAACKHGLDLAISATFHLATFQCWYKKGERTGRSYSAGIHTIE